MASHGSDAAGTVEPGRARMAVDRTPLPLVTKIVAVATMVGVVVTLADPVVAALAGAVAAAGGVSTVVRFVGWPAKLVRQPRIARGAYALVAVGALVALATIDSSLGVLVVALHVAGTTAAVRGRD